MRPLLGFIATLAAVYLLLHGIGADLHFLPLQVVAAIEILFHVERIAIGVGEIAAFITSIMISIVTAIKNLWDIAVHIFISILKFLGAIALVVGAAVIIMGEPSKQLPVPSDASPISSDPPSVPAPPAVLSPSPSISAPTSTAIPNRSRPVRPSREEQAVGPGPGTGGLY